MIKAAGTEPRLRALLSFLSLEALTFHRTTEFPWSNDLPFIVGDVQACTVYAPLHAPKRVLGESLTARACPAAALAVAHLPDDCGPALEGPWPPPGNLTD